MINVVLSWEKASDAACVGVRRHVSALSKNRQNTSGGDHANHWEQHPFGAMAEYSCALLTGTEWNHSIGQIDAVDVGSFEVRSTRLPQGRLIIRLNDNKGLPYVLVRGPWFQPTGCRFEIVGWINEEAGKVDDHLWTPNNGRGTKAYFIRPGVAGWHDINSKEDFPPPLAVVGKPVAILL